MNENKEIGQIIKNARKEKGYTQEELGNLIGVQKSAVAKYENGRVVNIKRSVLSKISKVLEIPPVELVSDIHEQIEENPEETGKNIGKALKDKNFLLLLSLYEKLDDEGKKDAIQHLEYLVYKAQKTTL